MSWTSAVTDTSDVSNVVLTASNSSGFSDSIPFNIVVPNTTTPAWTAVPSPAIIEGQSGSYTLPVTNATSVTWAGSVAKPAWLTLVADTPPRLTWTAAPAAATIDATCELIAVGPGGSVPSGKFPLSVVAQASGMWEAYPNSVTFTRLNGSTYSGAAPFHIPWESKHTRGAFRTANGRLYWGGGDFYAEDNGPASGQAALFSMDPANPQAVQQETLRYLTDINAINTAGCDQGGMVYVPTNDRLYLGSLNAFNPWGWLTSANAIVGSTAYAGQALNVPRYVSATSFKVSGNATAVLTANRLIRLHPNHTSVPNDPPTAMTAPWLVIDARVVSASFDGTDTLVTFTRSPIRPMAAFTRDGTAVEIHSAALTGSLPPSTDTGSWYDSYEIGYNEANGDKSIGLMEFNPTTRLYTRREFVLGSHYSVTASGALSVVGTALSRIHGPPMGTMVFVPAAVTGRNDEIHVPTTKGADLGFAGGWILDLSTSTAHFYTTGADGRTVTRTGHLGGGGNNGGLDPVRKVVWAYTGSDGSLYKWDVVKRRLDVVLDGYGGPGGSSTQLQATNGTLVPRGPNFGDYGDGYPTFYDSALDRIIILPWYSNGNSGSDVAAFLIHPDTLAITAVSSVAAGGKQVRSNAWYQTPDRIVGDGAQGGAGFVQTDRFVFIPKNLYSWQAMNTGSRYYIAPTRRTVNGATAGDPKTMDQQSMTLTSGLLFSEWSGIAAAVDASGVPTGEIQYRLGGDSDYLGNELHRLLLKNESGGTIPAQVNNATNSTNAQTWGNRCKVVAGLTGGTMYTPEILLNKDDLTEWAPGAGHHYDQMSYVPGIGYAEIGWAPISIPPTPENVTYPYAGQTDPKLFGLLSYGLNRENSVNTIEKSLIAWNETTGRWQKLCSLAVGGEGHLAAALAEWNPSTGKLLVMGTPSSFDRTIIWEWNGVPGSVPTKRNFAFNYRGATQVSMINGIYGAVTWLEGSKYIAYNRAPLLGMPRALTLFDSVSGAYTHLDGATGNALIDASHAAGYCIMFTVDRVRRKVWWFVPPVGAATARGWCAFKLYWSSFDDLMNLRLVPGFDNTQLDKLWVQKDGGYMSKLATVYGDHLYVMTEPTTSVGKIYRIPVF